MTSKLTASQELQKRLNILAGMISMGEKISWGSDSALMHEAANMLYYRDCEMAALSEQLANRDTTMIASARQSTPQLHDQTALELCAVCGWKAVIPDECCLNCEHEARRNKS